MHFGARKIWPPLLLAPMAGLTHSALRTTILAYGGIGLLSTEMLSAKPGWTWFDVLSKYSPQRASKLAHPMPPDDTFDEEVGNSNG